MKELFRKTISSIILSSIAAFIIGLILVVAPGLTLHTIGIIVGIYIIIHGVVLITLNFAESSYCTPFYGIMSGILSIILGIALVVMPGILSTIFAIALGIWIILSSIDIISIAIAAKEGISNWLLLLIFGIIDLIAGVLILFNPFASSISLAIISGIVIMVHSAVTIIDMIIIKKNVKEVVKAIESNFKISKN